MKITLATPWANVASTDAKTKSTHCGSRIFRLGGSDLRVSCEKEALTFRASGLYKGSVKGPLKAPLQDPIGLGDLVWAPLLLLFGVYNGTQKKRAKGKSWGISHWKKLDLRP